MECRHKSLIPQYFATGVGDLINIDIELRMNSGKITQNSQYFKNIYFLTKYRPIYGLSLLLLGGVEKYLRLYFLTTF